MAASFSERMQAGRDRAAAERASGRHADRPRRRPEGSRLDAAYDAGYRAALEEAGVDWRDATGATADPKPRSDADTAPEWVLAPVRSAPPAPPPPPAADPPPVERLGPPLPQRSGPTVTQLALAALRARRQIGAAPAPRGTPRAWARTGTRDIGHRLTHGGTRSVR